MWLLYLVRELLAPPGRRPCVSPSVLLFRVGFDYGFVRFCSGFDWERRPHSPCALWAFESIQSRPCCAFCDGFSFRFWCTRMRRFVELFGVIPVLLAWCQTLWNHQCFRIDVLELLRKPQSLLISPRILEFL